MLTEERQNLIAKYVNEHGICRVAELCELTASSESTIRRDLAELEQHGWLKRIHGGARSLRNFSRDVAQHIRFRLNITPKRQIAAFIVANEVNDGDYVFLDAGTTTYELVPYLAQKKQITVTTNGVDTAIACLNAHLETILIGGQLKIDTHAVVGAAALAQVSAMNYNVAFIGANGLDEKGQLTTPDPEEAAIKSAEIAHGEKSFVLLDSSKIGQAAFAQFANIREVNVVTNALSLEQRKIIPTTNHLKEIVS